MGTKLASYEAPEEIRHWDKSKRLKWWSDRIRKEQPIYDFIEDLSEGLTEEEMRIELRLVKFEIAKILRSLTLADSTEFTITISKLDEVVAKIKKNRSRWLFFLKKKWTKQKEEAIQIDKELREEAEELERTICKVCFDIKADPVEYMKLHTFIEVYDDQVIGPDISAETELLEN